MTGHHVLIVGSGGSVAGMLRSYGAGGVRTSVVCRLSSLSRIRDPEAHERVVAVGRDASEQEWCRAARLVHRDDPCTAIACYGELDQHRAALIAEDLGLDWHSRATVAAVQDKLAMRASLAAAGLDDTRHAEVRSLDELLGFLRAAPGDVVVKPVDGTASVGVSRVGDPAGAAAAWERARDGGEWSSGRVMVESALDGPQVSVECFSEHGRHVVVATTAKSSTPTTLVEVGHVCPAGHVDPAVHELTVAALDALGVRAGATHTELVRTPAGPRVIETHLRLAGDDIPDLVRDVTGIDLYRCTVGATLGGRILSPSGSIDPVRAPVALAAAIWFLAVDADGELVEVRGEQQSRTAAGVSELAVWAVPGASVRRLGSSKDRLGQVRTVADTTAEVTRRARHAASLVRFVVDATRDPFAETR